MAAYCHEGAMVCPVAVYLEVNCAPLPGQDLYHERSWQISRMSSQIDRIQNPAVFRAFNTHCMQGEIQVCAIGNIVLCVANSVRLI